MTVPDAVVPLTDGHVTVPANRWDLVTGYPRDLPTVAVVVPFYNQQTELERLVAALELQTHPRRLIHVVVADDGSAVAPTIPPTSLRVSTVRQDDLGFRAAAARNLGAAATDATVLCFLDADTVPEPSYLSEITRLPAQVPDALVVGRRRHAELDGIGPERLPDWWAGAIAPPVLREPAWLADAYRASGDLLDVDHRSYRYVISSVMCCSATLFADTGGFDESFGRYGGEDWEFAHRAMANGAVLHHARDAVAWHDGPDWADRPVADRRATKNAEALTLARRITDPDARRPGLRYALPDVAVQVDAAAHSAASLVGTIACFLHEDVGIWVDGPRGGPLLRETGIEDQRVRTGPIPEGVRRRCRMAVTVTGRAVLPRGAVTAVIDECARPGVGAVAVETEGASVVCRASWAVNRVRRWSAGAIRFADPADADRVSRTVTLPAADLDLRCAESEPDLSW
ncbi:glycosyltransferase [Mycobacterium manitobense]|uniref:Glycosyltransferase n=1 Tax=[Mycobacterium] manitobense TaxID=190147 RepID=A0A9X2YE67_9MYCO|nr:glycosyltransferase [[Mycobacterium] manitobense]MCV7172822.1 glycosyltransferase [[Mycobacterium] manitobense]